MEQNNLILVHFGSPAANQGKVGSRINLDLKVLDNVTTRSPRKNKLSR
jgi:hypothetical protein